MEFMEFVFKFAKELDTVIIAIVGFVSSIFIAKFTCEHDVKKFVYSKKIEAYERALSLLILKINVYANCLNLMGSLKRENQQAVLPMVSRLIGGTVQQMLELEKNDIDIAIISLYVDIQDRAPLKNFTKLSNFLQKASKLSNQLQNSNINIDDKNSLLDELSIAIDDFSSFAEAEYNYLSGIYDKLVNRFRNDKILHKLIDKV